MGDIPRVLFLSAGKANLSFFLKRMYERFGRAPCRIDAATVRPRTEVNAILRGAMESLRLDAGGFHPLSLPDCVGRRYELVVTIGADLDRARLRHLDTPAMDRTIHLAFDRIYAMHNSRVTRDFYVQIAGAFLDMLDRVDEAARWIRYGRDRDGKTGVLSACAVTESGLLRGFEPDRDIGTIADAGLDALELLYDEETPHHVDIYDLVAMKRIAKYASRWGVDLWAVSVGDVKRLASRDESMRRLQVCHTKHAVTLCELIGSRVVVLRESWPAAAEEVDAAAFKRSLEDLEPAVDLSPAVLGFETGPRWRRLKREIDAHADSSFGATLDVGFANPADRGSIDTVAESVGRRVASIHISDTNGVDDTAMLPGSGALDWDQVVAAIESLNYKGDLIYKVRNTMPNLRSYLDRITMAHQTYFGQHVRRSA